MVDNKIDGIRRDVTVGSESEEDAAAVDEEDDTAMEFPVNNVLAMSLTQDKEMTKREKVFSDACVHVRQASCQQKLCNNKMKIAQSDCKSNQPHQNCTRTVAMDHAQNCDLPHFGDTQGSNSCHHSLLQVNVFGIADSAVDGRTLDAFVCHEGVDRKGGNNVALMLMTHLKKKGWLQKGNPGRELNVVMDNCCGQNENNHVLRLALFPAEQHHFRSVNFMFCVVDHTRNMCDRFFNTLKRKCRRRNVFAMDDLVQLFNVQATEWRFMVSSWQLQRLAFIAEPTV